MAQAPATTPRRRADEPAPAVELTCCRGSPTATRRSPGPRPRSLLALLAGDLRTGASTARLVEGLWPDEQPEHPTKALQVEEIPAGVLAAAVSPRLQSAGREDDIAKVAAWSGPGRGTVTRKIQSI
jgi:hypothetical protein